MIKLIRTNSDNTDFQALVKELDTELRFRDGDEHAYYAQFNKIDKIKYVVMAYDLDEAVGCGAIKEYSADIMEVKRMYVPVNKRSLGIASKILQELEVWVKELQYKKCILETGVKQPEAIRLYEKNNYTRIPNYGQYINMENSVCFEKEII